MRTLRESEPLNDVLAIRGYRTLRKLGEGAMGIVYLALPDDDPSKHVAIKVLRPGVFLREKDTLRFAREGKAGRHLVHPHLLPVIDSGTSDGRSFIVMEYVEGTTLQQRVERRRELCLGSGEVPREAIAEDLHIVAKIARALHFAHERGVIHRDVKPGNILVRNDGHPFLIDFGLARVAEDGSSLTSSDVLLGTPRYMAPEQLVGDTHAVGAATDVYALGVTLYETVTGHRPYDARTFEEQRQRVLAGEPQSLKTFLHRPPQGLEPIIHKALEKEAQHRYATAAAMAEDIERVAAGLRPGVRRSALQLRRLTRKFGRQRLRVALVGLLVLGGIAGWLWREARARERQGRRLRAQMSYLQAELSLDRDDLQQALLDFQEAIDLAPDEPEGYLRRAAAYARCEQFARAADDVAVARTLGFRPDATTKDDAIESIAYAIYAMKEGDFDEAERVLREATRASPEEHAARFTLYQVQKRLGHLEDAHRTLDGLRSNLKERDPSFQLAEADLLEIDGRSADAAQRLWLLRHDRSLGADTEYRVVRSLGRLYCRLGAWPDAIEELLRAVDLNPRDAVSWLNLANAYYYANARFVSDRCAEIAMTLEPRFALAYDVRARVARARADDRAAMCWLEDALAVDPTFEPSRMLRAWIEFEQGAAKQRAGETGLATGLFREALETNPDQLGALIFLAQYTHSGYVHGGVAFPPDPAAALSLYVRANDVWDRPVEEEALDWNRTLRKPGNHIAILAGILACGSEVGAEDDVQRAVGRLREALAEIDAVPVAYVAVLVEALVRARGPGLPDCEWARELARRRGLRDSAATDASVRSSLDSLSAVCGDE